MDVIEQVTAVAAVLLLLIGTLWWLRRRGFATLALPGRAAGRRLECLERLPLGPQHTLHLIRLGEIELVIASSPGSCSLLHTGAHVPPEVRG
jgi:flagellar biosynthetic protein FliO